MQNVIFVIAKISENPQKKLSFLFEYERFFVYLQPNVYIHILMYARRPTSRRLMHAPIQRKYPHAAPAETTARGNKLDCN